MRNGIRRAARGLALLALSATALLAACAGSTTSAYTGGTTGFATAGPCNHGGTPLASSAATAPAILQRAQQALSSGALQTAQFTYTLQLLGTTAQGVAAFPAQGGGGALDMAAGRFTLRYPVAYWSGTTTTVTATTDLHAGTVTLAVGAGPATAPLPAQPALGLGVDPTDPLNYAHFRDGAQLQDEGQIAGNNVWHLKGVVQPVVTGFGQAFLTGYEDLYVCDGTFFPYKIIVSFAYGGTGASTLAAGATATLVFSGWNQPIAAAPSESVAGAGPRATPAAFACGDPSVVPWGVTLSCLPGGNPGGVTLPAGAVTAFTPWLQDALSRCNQTGAAGLDIWAWYPATLWVNAICPQATGG